MTSPSTASRGGASGGSALLLADGEARGGRSALTTPPFPALRSAPPRCPFRAPAPLGPVRVMASVANPGQGGSAPPLAVQRGIVKMVRTANRERQVEHREGQRAGVMASGGVPCPPDRMGTRGGGVVAWGCVAVLRHGGGGPRALGHVAALWHGGPVTLGHAVAPWHGDTWWSHGAGLHG